MLLSFFDSCHFCIFYFAYFFSFFECFADCCFFNYKVISFVVCFFSEFYDKHCFHNYFVFNVPRGTVNTLIFFGTKGEDRNSFVSIHRNKFAVQKQRVSDGAMKNAH